MQRFCDRLADGSRSGHGKIKEAEPAPVADDGDVGPVVIAGHAMQMWSLIQPVDQHAGRRPRAGRLRDAVTPMLAMAAGAVLAIAVVMLDRAGSLAYPLGLAGGVAALPWLVAAIPVSARYRASYQGFRALVLSIAVFVSLSGLYSGRIVPFVAGLGLLGVALTLSVVGGRLERS